MPNRGPLLWPLPLSSPVLEGEPGGMMDVKEVAKHHLVIMVLQKGVKVVGVVPGAGEQRRNIYIDEGKCGHPEIGLNCQNFRRVVVREYVTVRHPVRDGMVDKSNESNTTASGRAIASNGGIACETP